MATPRQSSVYRAGDWELDLGRQELRVRGVPVAIGQRALEIIKVLIEAAGELITKDELMSSVWPGAIVEDNTLQVHISAIRKALGPDRAMLQTVSGRGYRLLGGWAVWPNGSRAAVSPSAEPAPDQPAAAEQPPSNLPLATTELIGRASAMRRVRDLLATHRAITLAGPAGIGKTVLALEVARSVSLNFHGNVRLVELASLSNPTLVPSAVAGVLDLKLGGDRISAESVARAIGTGKLLLVLDNCEHVIDAVAAIAEVLLHLCPNTSILATSQEVLRIEGENVFRVPPLDVPPRDMVDSGDVLAHGAVQLLVARTRAQNFDFSPSREDITAITSICRRLDGIPLAIEFAAARAATLGLQQVGARLDDRLSLLAGGRRTALPRHQTLRAALDWSHELLTEPERLLLRRLAIFPAGFTLDAAVAVMQGMDARAAWIAEGISSLVAKSLVAFDGSGYTARWRLLETIRAYALEKLAEFGETDAVARLHARYFRDHVASDVPGSRSLSSGDDIAFYVREIDNVRAALDWAFSPAGEPALGVDLTAVWSPVWLHLAFVVECRERVERALANITDDAAVDPRFHLRLLVALAYALMLTMGPTDRIHQVIAKALEIAGPLDDTDTQLRTLWSLWAIQINVGECRMAWTTARRFADVASHAGQPGIVLTADRLMASTLQYAGRLREARSYLERVLEAYVEQRDQLHASWFQSPYDQRVMARAVLARTLWLQGSVEQALVQARICLEEGQAAAQKMSLCWALRLAACPIALLTGDLDAADRSVTMLNDMATRNNSAMWRIVGRCLQGHLLILRGEHRAGTELLLSGLAESDAAGLTKCFPDFQGVLAEGLGAIGLPDQALAAVDDALSRSEQSGEEWYVPELLRIKAGLLARRDGDAAVAAAEACFRQAIETARNQEALFWELRAAIGFARLRMAQSRHADAERILAPAHDKFTEGFDTADFGVASVMLTALRQDRLPGQPPETQPN